MSEDEKPSVPDILAEIFEEVCDKYCKYMAETNDAESALKNLREKCADCPLMRLL